MINLESKFTKTNYFVMTKTGCAGLIISDRSNYHARTMVQYITLAFTICVTCDT